MSQNNTNRDIRRFETDADGNTTRVLLNTDEPLGLLDGDYQEQLKELENRLNAITGGAYSNTVQIGHGGTGAESAQIAFDNLISSLNSSLAGMIPSFIVKRDADGAGAAISVNDAINALGALKASNNLSDLQNTLTGLQNLYHDVPIAEPQGGVPLKDWFDGIYVMLGHNISEGGVNYRVEPNCYTLKSLVDNYLSEYLLKASNNLSDLSNLSTALGNLLNDVDTFEPVPGPPIDTQLYNLELYLGYLSGPQSSPFIIPKKLTVEYLYENYILPVLNTEYGMTKDSQTNLYEFTGNAATADVSTTARGLSMTGGSVNMALKSVTKQIASGQNTYVFSSSDSNSFSANDTIIGIRGFVTGGNGSVSIKNDYTIENTATGKTVTVDANVSTDGVAEVYLFCYYLHNLND